MDCFRATGKPEWLSVDMGSGAAWIRGVPVVWSRIEGSGGPAILGEMLNCHCPHCCGNNRRSGAGLPLPFPAYLSLVTEYFRQAGR